jgi:hypothetical protein
MPYHIKKPSQLNSSVDVYYMGEKRWSDTYSERKQYTNNPTYLTTNTDGKNGGWEGFTVVTE